ncbi:hypothetical protein [Acidisphaera sp. L21]|uniref:hypothetical protein n=1 Tax=Acidisphaera sp. L21 TaxID=1641851 RepID=UPI00131CB131|nr:hypothetical protein [Acidisphaera sp. L21]
MLNDGGFISVQVLNGVTKLLRRKRRLSWPDTHNILTVLRVLLTVQPNTLAVHTTGLCLAERYRLSFTTR